MANDKTDALAIGTIVGGYRIAYRMGGGGMSTVYAAEEPTIGKLVAIKVLSPVLAGDATFVARLEREARAAVAIKHPAIVDVFGFGRLADGRPYLVMSHLEGRSLGEEIAKRGRLPASEAWPCLRVIADALGAAHAAGMIHRDVKPENVFLERSAGRADQPRLLDLGIVKLTDDADEGEPQPMKLTQTGVPIGTPAFMAPEQWWGESIDARSDQYAFGVTLFETLSGTLPFRGQRVIDLAQAHLNTVPPTLASVGCVVAPAVEALVARCLQKAPAERFESMAELIAAGDAAFDASAGDSHPVSATADTHIAEPVAPPEPLAEPAQRRLPFPVVHALAVALGVGLLLSFGYAGEARHDLLTWAGSGGYQTLPVAGLFVAGVFVNLVAFAKRSTFWRVLPWAIPLTIALIATVGAYIGWHATTAAELLAAPQRFEILHMGVYEIEGGHFFGLSLAAILAFSLALAANAKKGQPGAQLEQAAAWVLTTLLVGGAAMTRVNGREAVAWMEQPTRAARAAELSLAHSERLWTLSFAFVAASLVALLQIARLARARPTLSRPPAHALVCMAIAAGIIAADVTLRVRFAQARERLHAELLPQFTLFARLDPPSAPDLDPRRFVPHPGPALQIARTTIGVNGRPIATLTAAQTAEGEANIGRDLTHALAEYAASGEPAIDLSIAIDRDVPWSVVLKLLRVAHRAGARHAELLLTRGPGPTLTSSAPPEASWVLARDFAALDIQLDQTGFEADAQQRFADVAPALVERALASDGPLHIALGTM